jgi:hypothetical protein
MTDIACIAGVWSFVGGRRNAPFGRPWKRVTTVVATVVAALAAAVVVAPAGPAAASSSACREMDGVTASESPPRTRPTANSLQAVHRLILP